MRTFVYNVEADVATSLLVLQLILEEVIFTIDFADHDDIDVHTLLRMVTTIALGELRIPWLGESSDSRFDENSKSFLSRGGTYVCMYVLYVYKYVHKLLPRLLA